jgi:hypothetical protein
MNYSNSLPHPKVRQTKHRELPPTREARPPRQNLAVLAAWLASALVRRYGDPASNPAIPSTGIPSPPGVEEVGSAHVFFLPF